MKWGTRGMSRQDAIMSGVTLRQMMKSVSSLLHLWWALIKVQRLGVMGAITQVDGAVEECGRTPSKLY